MSRKLIERRIEKAESTFIEGLRLFEMGYCNGAVNRFYYADYDDFKVFHRAEVEKLKEDVREFLEEVKHHRHSRRLD